MKDLNCDKAQNSFDVWRIVMTLVIMCFHLVLGATFYTEYSYIHYHWYIAVEFFFILSGFLLAQHAENNRDESAFQYTKKRVARLYPLYFVAFIVMCIIRSLNSGLNIFKIIIPNWPELIMCQSIGTNVFPYINNPAWYVSALLIGGHVVYYLYKKHKSLYLEFVGPVSLIVIMSYMYRQYGRLENFYHTEGLFLNTALMRAFLGLTIGIYVFLISQKCKEHVLKISQAVIAAMEVLIFFGTLFFALIVEEGSYDFVFVFLFAIGILLSSLDTGLAKLSACKVIKVLSELSYGMYLCHFAVLAYIGKIIDIGTKWHWWYVPIYIGITMVVAWIYHMAAKILIKCVGRIYRSISQ
ncbi:MAG: acyltransferase [Lachnospiraceae bacterium]|nr:acyltransferase [Lachnospiraceae bacterium]